MRARLNVLSELPGAWKGLVMRWRAANRRFKTELNGRPAPDANEEYHLYQTLVGAWPFNGDKADPVFRKRIDAYMMKALREAKIHTSWLSPDEAYERAVTRFIDAVLDASRPNAFLASFLPFQARVAELGIYNSLAQLMIKVTAPGIPDFYQGTELWDLSLVDPDNRRPVDWSLRRRLLAELGATIAAAGDRAALAQELVKTREDGRVKMYLIREALALRARRRALYERGDYRPLEVHGAWAEHVCAFARTAEGGAAVTVIPRLLARRGPDTLPHGLGYWADTWLEIPGDLAGRYTNVLTGEALETTAAGGGAGLPLGAVLAAFPVALLDRQAP